jgi:predicted outer membrane protein
MDSVGASSQKLFQKIFCKSKVRTMKIYLTIATVATLLSSGLLTAQERLPGQPRAITPQAKQSAPADNSSSKDQVLAKWLTIANQEDIAIAMFARDRLTSERAKAFATTLTKEHQQCLDELKGLAAKGTSEKRTSEKRTSEKGTSEKGVSEGLASSARPPVATKVASGFDFLQMHQEMSEQRLLDSKEMLSQKEGTGFDAYFVGMQIARHGMMHSKLTVLQRHSTGELQGFIETSLAKNKEHLDAATDLMEQLSGEAVAKTAKAK